MNILKKMGLLIVRPRLSLFFCMYACHEVCMYMYMTRSMYVCGTNIIMHYCLYVYLGWREMD